APERDEVESRLGYLDQSVEQGDPLHPGAGVNEIAQDLAEPPGIDERGLPIAVRRKRLPLGKPAVLPDPFAVFPVAPGVEVPDGHATSAVEGEGQEDDRQGTGKGRGPGAKGQGSSGRTRSHFSFGVGRDHAASPWKAPRPSGERGWGE